MAQTSADDAKLKPLFIAMPDQIRDYAELRELVRVSLRTQNPEWVEPDGVSPICDAYEARFAELLGLTLRKETTRPAGVGSYADRIVGNHNGCAVFNTAANGSERQRTAANGKLCAARKANRQNEPTS
jgi:hypothetical protein